MRMLRALALVGVCLCFCSITTAQTVTGHTQVDVDQASGTVTATCETDLDPNLVFFYQATVACKLQDSTGAGSWHINSMRTTGSHKAMRKWSFTDWIDAGCPQTMPPCRL